MGSLVVVDDGGSSGSEARSVTLGVLEVSLLPKDQLVLGVEGVHGSPSDEYRDVARGCSHSTRCSVGWRQYSYLRKEHSRSVVVGGCDSGKVVHVLRLWGIVRLC